MVHLDYFWVFLLFASANSQFRSREIKTVTSNAKRKLNSGIGEDFHCDLKLLPEQEEILYKGASIRKSGGSSDSYKWLKNPKGLVVVPYVILKNSLYTYDQLITIRHAMDSIENQTCIRFWPRNLEKDFVTIFSGKLCQSNLGRIGGPQELSLNKNKCLQSGIVAHELMHTLGFIHMHSRPNRDKFVKIAWRNINPKYRREFELANPKYYNYFGTSYDYLSIMHYGSKAASINKAWTIIPTDEEYLNVIGQRDRLSDGDIKRLNNKYDCKALQLKPSFDYLVDSTNSTERIKSEIDPVND